MWPFDGSLSSLLMPGRVVIAETYPAECCRWFSNERLRSKRNQDDRIRFGTSLLRWADTHDIMLANCLTEDIQSGFPQGDDAFDAVVGLFGMLQVCLGQRASGEPDKPAIREIEGWILGWEP
jgi:hypothetical protein